MDREDKFFLSFFMGLLLMIGFLLNEARVDMNTKLDKADVVEKLVEASDNLQELASRDKIGMDESIVLRQDIIDIIKRVIGAEF